MTTIVTLYVHQTNKNIINIELNAGNKTFTTVCIKRNILSNKIMYKITGLYFITYIYLLLIFQLQKLESERKSNFSFFLLKRNKNRLMGFHIDLAFLPSNNIVYFMYFIHLQCLALAV